MTKEWDDYRRGKVRAWLSDVSRVISKIRLVANQLKAESEAYDMLRGMPYDRDDAKPAILHGDDSIAAHIIRIQQRVEELHSLDREYAAKVAQAKDVFSRLKSHPCACEVMTDHYILEWKWERVASSVGYSEVWVKRIADEATLECYSLMPVEWRDPMHPAL